MSTPETTNGELGLVADDGGRGRGRADLLAALADTIRHRFGHPGLLDEALKHRSWIAEHPSEGRSNEQLEFLGDAVLGAAVADLTHRRHPHLSEGAMSELRSAVVSTVALAELAGQLQVGNCLLLGRGEENTGGRRKPSILADAFEAILGAVMVDGGYLSVRATVDTLIGARIDELAAAPPRVDPKTALQELAVRCGYHTPVYTVSDAGPDHAKLFTATVTFANRTATGEAATKRHAETSAAAVMLSTFGPVDA